MSHKKRVAAHVNHERWLVSYADFITLLFAFFVVLFSSSQVDKRKVGKVSVAIQEAFQQMGIFQAANSRVPIVTTNPLPSENLQVIEDGQGISGRGRLASPINKLMGFPPSPDTAALQKKLTGALGAEIQKHAIVLKERRDGLVISLQEIGFYDSGSADLRPGSEGSVERIAGVLMNEPNDIRIEGHTDDVPIHNSHFASNWELSTARATGLIRLFVTQFNLPATRLSAAGYAEYHPVAGNDTTEGRAQNRRVDIVVLNATPSVQTSMAEAATPKAESGTHKAEGRKQ